MDQIICNGVVISTNFEHIMKDYEQLTKKETFASKGIEALSVFKGIFSKKKN